MNPRVVEACQSLQSAQKACWEILLRELPETESLSQDVLSAAMDQTLEQFWALARTRLVTERLREAGKNPPPLKPAQGECELSALLPYFKAGERALKLIVDEVARTHPAAARRGDFSDELRAAFHVLVQCQLETICGQCRRSGQCRYGSLTELASLADDRILPAAARSEAPEAASTVKRNRRILTPAIGPRRRRVAPEV
jgi:hypothetical protein